MLESILTNRRHQTWPSWDIVHEWEECLSQELNLPLLHLSHSGNGFLGRVNNRLSSLPFYRQLRHWRSSAATHGIALVFHLQPHRYVPAHHIPVIIDFWKHQNLNEFISAYKSCALVLISSREVYDYLLDKGCPVNIEHWALSLPDKYLNHEALLVEKDIDIIQPGRQNQVFSGYVDGLLKAQPNLHYVYQKQTGGELCYYSNQYGNMQIGVTRKDYFSLLARSKIALYSSPGLDGGKHRTGGFNPVTPRLLECISQYCHVLSRYENNSDAQYYQLKDKCLNIKSQGQFIESVDGLIKSRLTQQDRIDNYNFLKPHSTKLRARQLRKLILNLASGGNS